MKLKQVTNQKVMIWYVFIPTTAMYHIYAAVNFCFSIVVRYGMYASAFYTNEKQKLTEIKN